MRFNILNRIQSKWKSPFSMPHNLHKTVASHFSSQISHFTFHIPHSTLHIPHPTMSLRATRRNLNPNDPQPFHTSHSTSHIYKRGIGIMEVMVAALVLGILYAAVSNLQKGNREALLRIRGRDGATEVAQNVIDSLGALGLASFTDDMLISDGEGGYTLAKVDTEGNKVPAVIQIPRTWEGQPGIVQNTMTVNYDVSVKVSPDETYRAGAQSLLRSDADSVSHVYAKRLDVTVSWPFKNSTQSITVSGVVR